MTVTAVAADKATTNNLDRYFEERPGAATIYYPFGKARAGYVIDTPAREAMLRDDVRKKLNPVLASVMSVIAGPLVYLFIHDFSWWLVLALATLLVLNAVRVRLRVRGLVAGLEQVAAPAADKTALRHHLACFAAIGLAIWAIDESYAPGAGITYPRGFEVFYPDILTPLLSVGMFAGLTWITFNPGTRADLIRRVGVQRFRVACVAMPLLLLGSAALAAFTYFSPRPSVTVTPFGLVCDSQTIRWAAISEMSLVQVGARWRWQEYASLTLDPRVSAGHASAECKVDGTTAGYQMVYDTIHKAWLQNRGSSVTSRTPR